MATSSAVVAGEEQSARFHHLLRPIRDLADSWNIDLASDLATYVDELSAIQISLDGGSTTVNFAEAALLIQGSACVYSKKVEYLYSLVYQTLNRVSEKERAPLQTATVDARGVDLDAPTPRLHEVDFLTLDFLQEGANLLLSEEDALGLDNEAITSKTPMHVLASGELGAGSGALHMRGASMHASGVLMLDNWEGADPASARMLDTMLVGMASASGARPTCTAGAPALGAPVGVGPSPAIAGQLALTFDAAVGADSADAEREDEYDDDDGGDFGGAPDFADDMDDGREAREGGVPVAGGGRDGAPPAAVGAFTVAIADGQPVLTAPAACAPLGGGTAPLGPWTPLDPNDASGAADPRPFRKGRTWKLPPKSAGALEPLRAGAKRDTHGRPVHVAAGGSVCGAPAEPCAPAGSSAPDSPDGGDACALRSRVALLAADLLAPSGLAAGAWSIKGQPGLHAHFGPKMEAESRRRAAVRKAARDALATHAHVPPAAEAEADADLDVDADADLAADGAFLALADGAHDAHGEGDDADAELDGLDGGAAFGDDDDDDDSGGGAVDFAPSAREDPVTDVRARADAPLCPAHARAHGARVRATGGPALRAAPTRPLLPLLRTRRRHRPRVQGRSARASAI